MSTVVMATAVPIHQTLPRKDNSSNGILGRTINKSKVYPVEESTHSGPVLEQLIFPNLGIHNDEVSSVVLEESQKDLTIWRHGDRAPVHYFQNFTEKYMIAFPRGIGNLTKIGAEQAEYLGLLLQRRYFHSRNITSKQIYIRSTDVPRTIETARYVLKGMSFSDIRINTETPTNFDVAGNPFFDCPVASQFVLDQKEEYFLRENFSDVYELMERELNYNDQPYYLFDTLNCLKAHDLALPEWLNDQEFWHGVEALFGMESYNNELQRKIRGGSSLRGVVSRIACKVNYSEWKPVNFCNERFYGLSAHDMTIVALLSTFSNIHSILGEVPLIGYGGNIAFEIWQIDNLYKMKVLYANQWDENPKEITQFAPGCGDSINFAMLPTLLSNRDYSF
ncbi:Acid phosphatase 5 [Dirofilaria immitis]|nr:Acid phosphatase 5 [Dirofilaria immitis]